MENSDPVQRLRAALDAAGDAVVVTDATGVILEANMAAGLLNGLDIRLTLGRSIIDLAIHDGGDAAELDALRRAVAGETLTYEARRTTRDGRPVVTRVRARPVPGGGALLIMPGPAAKRESEIRAARTRLLTVAARSLAEPEDLERLGDLLVPEWADGLIIALTGADGRLDVRLSRTVDPRANGPALAALPLRMGDVRPTSMTARAMRDGIPVLVERETPGLDAATQALLDQIGVGSLVIVPLADAGEPIGLLAAHTGLDRQRAFDADDLALFGVIGDRLAQRLQANRLEARFRAAFEHAPIGIAITRPDAQDIVRYAEVNPALCLIMGYPRDQLIGTPVSEFTHPDDRGAEERRVRWLADEGIPDVGAEKRLVRPDGEVRWVQTRSSPLGDGSFVTQLQDITESRRFQAELEHLASHDPLTGVLNRRRFEEALEQALAHVRRHGEPAAIVTLDLDNFKHVNDTYGHGVGDEVLRAAAAALASRLRATDQIGRLGGDEFGVILWRTDVDDAAIVARELVGALRDVRLPVGERRVGVTASAGLRALEALEARTAGELLSEADMAMYDAKERGRDRVAVLRPGDLQPQRVRARARWSERIRDALDGSGFLLYEQPIVRLSDGVADRSELLIRMADPEDATAVVCPDDFLPIAERYGQIQAIDRWVVEHAIALLAQRTAAGAPTTLEVNLSADTLSDPDALHAVANLVAGAPVDPSLLIFEVTETSAIGNLDRARELAQRLIALGCGFALDDFGSGFGSFAYLKHLPVDIIKIDGQFVRELRTSEADQVTVRAIVDVARGLGKETVAEWVEDEPTLALLRELGVDRAQGYLLGRPQPVSGLGGGGEDHAVAPAATDL